MKILGIDPGTTSVGYGLIKKEGDNYNLINSGLLKIKSKESKERLLEIEKSLSSLIKKTNPDRVGVEKIFFSKNKKTAIKVAQARGVIILSLAKSNTDIFELSPSEVKSSITGNGNASKDDVAKMVKYFVKDNNVEKLQDDITDAIAIAIATSNLNKQIYENN